MPVDPTAVKIVTPSEKNKDSAGKRGGTLIVRVALEPKGADPRRCEFKATVKQQGAGGMTWTIGPGPGPHGHSVEWPGGAAHHWFKFEELPTDKKVDITVTVKPNNLPALPDATMKNVKLKPRNGVHGPPEIDMPAQYDQMPTDFWAFGWADTLPATGELAKGMFTAPDIVHLTNVDGYDWAVRFDVTNDTNIRSDANPTMAAHYVTMTITAGGNASIYIEVS